MGLFNWIGRRAARTMADDADRFLISLKGADQQALDVILAAAMHWAAYYDKKGRDLYRMEEWIHSNIAFPMELVATIKAMQRQGTPASATGLMVWLHSARAVIYPDIRLYGRQIWAELAKSTDESDFLAVDMATASGVSSYLPSRFDVPLGLEPISR